MAYLIDGNNFLGYSSPLNRNAPENRQNLIFKLLKFQQIKNTRIILVFDGSPDLDLIEKPVKYKRFSILYPHLGENADERIKEIILKQTDRRRFYIVSSDRELRSYAKSKGIKALKCEEFDRELRKALKEYKKAREEDKNVSTPSSLEINQWHEVFKKRND